MSFQNAMEEIVGFTSQFLSQNHATIHWEFIGTFQFLRLLECFIS